MRLAEHVLRQSRRGTRKLIHVIDTVMYNLASIVAYSEEQNNSLNYIALIHNKFLLTYSVLQTGTQWYHTDLPGSSCINTYFPSRIQTSSYLYFLETRIRST